MAASAVEVQGIDLFDHRQSQSMHEVTRSWRASTPIVRLDPKLLYVARWHDCWEVLRDPLTFGNANGFKVVDIPEEERSLGEMDPPRHPALRRVMRTGFTRQFVASQADYARRRADALVDEIARMPSAELVSAFCDRLPNDVSLHMLGVPERDSQQLIDWAKDLLHSDWTWKHETDRGFGIVGGFPEFSAYLDALVEARRAPDAPDDVIARLVRCQLDGRPLSATVLRTLCVQLIVGGFSTGTNMLGNLLYRLLREPDLHATIRARPELIPAALEESLRLDPPVVFVLRNVMRETSLRGVPLEPGERLALGILSANRDESVFPDADALRLDRGAPQHLTFSGGAHLCIGASTARLVGREALRAFTQRFEPGEVELAPGFEYHGVPVFLEHGPERLDVRRALARSTTSGPPR
ncbi:MAG: cytochrome P450 [Myxococcota bacterium]